MNAEIEFRRQNLTYKVGPRTERVKEYERKLFYEQPESVINVIAEPLYFLFQYVFQNM